MLEAAIKQYMLTNGVKGDPCDNIDLKQNLALHPIKIHSNKMSRFLLAMLKLTLLHVLFKSVSQNNGFYLVKHGFMLI